MAGDGHNRPGWKRRRRALGNWERGVRPDNPACLRRRPWGVTVAAWLAGRPRSARRESSSRHRGGSRCGHTASRPLQALPSHGRPAVGVVPALPGELNARPPVAARVAAVLTLALDGDKRKAADPSPPRLEEGGTHEVHVLLRPQLHLHYPATSPRGSSLLLRRKGDSSVIGLAPYVAGEPGTRLLDRRSRLRARAKPTGFEIRWAEVGGP